MRTNAHVLNKNEQKCALFGPLFGTPLRVWCYVDNLYLVFRILSEEFFRRRLTPIDADLFGHEKALVLRSKYFAE